MTFKKITALSMILFFVVGAFAIAEEPSVNKEPCDPVSTSDTLNEVDSAPYYEIEYQDEYDPAPQQDWDQNDNDNEQRLRQMYYEGEFSKKSTSENPLQLVSDSTPKQAVTKQTTTKQESSPKAETVIEESEVIEVSPTPTHVYSNRGYHGYSVQQIRNMPMVARPDRPGHFVGNTVRAIYRNRRGR